LLIPSLVILMIVVLVVFLKCLSSAKNASEYMESE